jgi:hypothetical protein
MIGFTSELRPANKIITDDWFKLGGRLVRVLDSRPQGKQEQLITFYFTDRVMDGIVPGTAVLPRNVELKIYNQCVLRRIDHHDCPVCGRKR